MANLSAVLNQLRSERNRAARELDRLNKAIAALDHIGARGGRRIGGIGKTLSTRGRRARRRFSAAARARMAAAQRARWAKLKAKR